MSQKPIITYRKKLTQIIVGHRAVLTDLIGHPNKQIQGVCVMTSAVVKKFNEDDFETENSRYEKRVD